MNDNRQGFREIEHTADWELHIWAPDLAALFEQAAVGMYKLSGTVLESGVRVTHPLKISATDHESLLVSFLAELLFFGESEGLGFDEYSFQISEGTLSGEIRGTTILAQEKEIKAVTFHEMEILTTSLGLAVNIVFDV